VLLALTLGLLFSLLVRRESGSPGVAGIALVVLYPSSSTPGRSTLQTLSALSWSRRSGSWTGSIALDRVAVRPARGDAQSPGPHYPDSAGAAPIIGGWLLLARRATLAQVPVVLLAVGAAVVPRGWCATPSSWGLRWASLPAPASTCSPATAPTSATISPPATCAGRRGSVSRRLERARFERDRILGRAARQWMTENLAEAARLYARKLLYWFAFENDAVSDRPCPAAREQDLPGSEPRHAPGLRSPLRAPGGAPGVVRLMPRFSALDVLLLAPLPGGRAGATVSLHPHPLSPSLRLAAGGPRCPVPRPGARAIAGLGPPIAAAADQCPPDRA
jgi:hypothetical protein